MNLRPAPEFEAWRWTEIGILEDGLRLRSKRALPAPFARAIGQQQSSSRLWRKNRRTEGLCHLLSITYQSGWHEALAAARTFRAQTEAAAPRAIILSISSSPYPADLSTSRVCSPIFGAIRGVCFSQAFHIDRILNRLQPGMNLSEDNFIRIHLGIARDLPPTKAPAPRSNRSV